MDESLVSFLIFGREMHGYLYTITHFSEKYPPILNAVAPYISRLHCYYDCECHFKVQLYITAWRQKKNETEYLLVLSTTIYTFPNSCNFVR